MSEDQNIKVELYRIHRVLSRTGDVFRPNIIGAPTQHDMSQTRNIVKIARVLLERALYAIGWATARYLERGGCGGLVVVAVREGLLGICESNVITVS